MCGHTSSLCQTFARLSSPGEKWIVSCHPYSGGRGEEERERERERKREKERRGEGEERGGGSGTCKYVERDDVATLDMQWRDSLADGLD